MDVPGLSGIARNVILEQISKVMVMPNTIYIPLSEIGQFEKDIPHTFPDLCLVRIVVAEAKDLVAKDIRIVGKNTSDPYCVVNYKEWVRS